MVDQPVLSASGHPLEGMPKPMVSEDLANQILSTQKLKIEEVRKVLEKEAPRPCHGSKCARCGKGQRPHGSRRLQRGGNPPGL